MKCIDWLTGFPQYMFPNPTVHLVTHYWKYYYRCTEKRQCNGVLRMTTVPALTIGDNSQHDGLSRAHCPVPSSQPKWESAWGSPTEGSTVYSHQSNPSQVTVIPIQCYKEQAFLNHKSFSVAEVYQNNIACTVKWYVSSHAELRQLIAATYVQIDIMKATGWDEHT